MGYRIHEVTESAETTLQFEGLLDEAALAELRARISAGRRTMPVRIVLRTGTEVAPACVEEVASLPVAGVVAESPYLSRWLDAARAEGRRSEEAARPPRAPSASKSRERGTALVKTLLVCAAAIVAAWAVVGGIGR
jgi:hypothetical protein